MEFHYSAVSSNPERERETETERDRGGRSGGVHAWYGPMKHHAVLHVHDKMIDFQHLHSHSHYQL